MSLLPRNLCEASDHAMDGAWRERGTRCDYEFMELTLRPDARNLTLLPVYPPFPPLTCMLDDRPQGWPGAWPHCPLTWHTTSVTLRSSVSVHRPQHPASQDASSTRVGLTQMADWLPDTWPSYYQCYLLHETKWNPVIGIVDAHYSWVDYLERKFRRHISCNTWQP